MSNLANPFIRAMTAYQPPIEGRRKFNGLLLDFCERMVPVPEQIIDAVVVKLRSEGGHIYPEYGNITQRIAQYADVLPEQVMITNGSDQGIDLIFRVFCAPGDRVIIPSPSFAMFYQAARSCGAQLVMPSYTPDLHYPLPEVLEAINQGARIVLVCNPNNPTGTLVKREEIEIVLKQSPHTLVFVDEAYFEFSQQTAIFLLKRYPNLVISRTFSKAFGLVAFRLGYLLASPDVIQELLKVRGPYDINMPAVWSAEEALRDTSYVREYAAEVREARPLVENFFRTHQIPYWPSAANFILFKPTDALGAAEKLQRNGILVRPRSGPQIEDTLRVTIGTPAQMKKFCDIYKQAVLSV